MARPVTGLLVGRILVGGLLGASLLGLTACAADRGGSIAVGGGAPAPVASTPSGKGVLFVPLDPSTSPGGTTGNGAGTTQSGDGTGGTSNSSSGGTTGGAGTTGATGAPGTSGSPDGAVPTTVPPAGGGSGNGRSGGSTPPPGGTPSAPPPSSTPQTPASLAVTKLTTAATADRWCQQVTLQLVNSGGRTAPVSGTTVTFATHVIGLLGIDWWTYQTSQALSAPVPGHATVNETWTVCLDSWRVPAGMHLDTEAATLS
ncbi:hypothetical protein [Streptacidiphilus sp. MAP5-3]|uniref:hypothetical protein n=1 Tax=unclassified Streptacidiphilus TaxID=2643834 RepID=UPI0035156D69